MAITALTCPNCPLFGQFDAERFVHDHVLCHNRRIAAYRIGGKQKMFMRCKSKHRLVQEVVNQGDVISFGNSSLKFLSELGRVWNTADSCDFANPHVRRNLGWSATVGYDVFAVFSQYMNNKDYLQSVAIAVGIKALGERGVWPLVCSLKMAEDEMKRLDPPVTPLQVIGHLREVAKNSSNSFLSGGLIAAEIALERDSDQPLTIDQKKQQRIARRYLGFCLLYTPMV